MRVLGIGALVTLSLCFLAPEAGAQTSHNLVFSDSPTRTPFAPLAGAEVDGDICVFVTPQTGVTRVTFYLDTPVTGTPYRIEGAAPWDFNGTGPAPALLAIPYATTALPDGFHTIIAVVTRTSGGPLTLTGTFSVNNVAAALGFVPGSASYQITGAGTAGSSVSLAATDGSAAAFTTSVSAGATWLSVSSAQTTTPATIAVSVNSAGLAPGNYSATVTAAAGGLTSATLPVSLLVIDPSTTYDLLISPGPDRVGAVSLADGLLVSGGIHVFTGPDIGVQAVNFYIDNPAATGTPFRRETVAPFDLAGSTPAPELHCIPFDTTTLLDGPHTLTVRLELSSGSTPIITRGILVSNQPAALTFGAITQSLNVDQGTSTSFSRNLITTTGAASNFQLSSSAPSWLTATCAGCTPAGAGSAPANVVVTVNASALATGPHSATITATDPAGIVTPGTLTVSIIVIGPGAYSLLASELPDRSSPVSLDGATLDGNTYVFLSPATGVAGVDFFIDDPTLSGTPYRIETTPPWDLAGGTDAAAIPVDTNTFADGFHTLSAEVTLIGGGFLVVEANFLVANGPPALVFSPPAASLALEAGDSTSLAVDALTNYGTNPAFTLSSNAAWLSATGTGGTGVFVEIDAAGLATGTYTGAITASAPGHLSGSFTVSLVVFTSGNFDILFSTSSTRANAVNLQGKNVFGDIHVFVSPVTGVSQVRFHIDDPAASGTPHRIEASAPFDLNGGTVSTAVAYPTSSLGDGLHSITAVITLAAGGSETVFATFNVANGTPGLLFQPGELTVIAAPDGHGSAQASVLTTDGSSTSFTLVESAPWLVIEQTAPNSGLAVLFGIDASGLAAGSHTAAVTAQAPGYLPVTLLITVIVSGSDTFDISYSLSSSLASPQDLTGATVSGGIWVHLTPSTGVASVAFYVDDPTQIGSPFRVEGTAPFELAGGEVFDTTGLGDGTHTITAAVTLAAGGQEIIQSSFTVQNGVPILQFGTPLLIVAVGVGETSSGASTLATSNGAAAAFTISESAEWLVVVPTSGTTPASPIFQVNAVDLGIGTYDAFVTASAPGFGDATIQVRLSVQGESIYDLLFSTSPDRSNPALLAGAETTGAIHVFTSPDSQVQVVRFFVDNPSASGAPFRTEGNAPFDMAGGSPAAANPFFTTNLADGPHSVTAVLDLTTGLTEVITANFLVLNNGPTLSVSPASMNFLSVTGEGAPAAQMLGLSTTSGAVATYSIASTASWLTVIPVTGSTPATVEVTADPTELADGGYTASLLVSAPGYSTVTIPVVLTIGDDLCSPLPCTELLVDLPHLLDFAEDHGGVPSAAASGGTGTGFTMILPTQFGEGYIPSRIEVDSGAGLLTIQSTAGSMSGDTNNQDNALGVGIDIPSQVSLIETRMVEIPPLTGNSEQFGLWFGLDDRNFVRLFVNSTPTGDRVRFLMEVNDTVSAVKFDSPILDVVGGTVDLVLRVNPVDREVIASYAVDGGPLQALGTHSPPPEFFSFDGAGINPEIGTRSFSGIFASHRNAPAPQTFAFDSFSVTAEALPPPQTEIAFDRFSFPQTVIMPTSMVLGPDGRLYVLELQGRIHAFELGPNRLPISQQVINTFQNTLGPRLSLGITVGPNATPSNVDLWVCHSGPNPDAGEINSGTVTRLSGPNFTIVENVVVGLPRAFANHAPNSLHFGPDGRLYVTIGGNTGSGAPNTSGSEFGTRMEQYLSAALLAVDVHGPGVDWPIDCFDGMINDNPFNEPTIPPCASGASPIVEVYSSGLRNVYDFTFHPNGFIYGPDNGLGVTGTYPATPFVPCFGPASTVTNNPGEQPDLLLLLEPGMYYGHPNPSRDECVYKDGSLQGVPPLPNYQAPMLLLGDHKSANGIISYDSGGTAFCGALEGSLLLTNYSVGDDLTRVQLAADGRSSIGPPFQLVAGFNDPLPIAQDGEGAIFIGEFGGDRITVLVPKDTGCWAIGQPPMPLSLLDVSGASVGGRFYVFAGKTSAGPVKSLLIYDPATGIWSFGPERPSVAVENPAVVAHNGKLWIFGGSTLPFSGMIAESFVFDPAIGPSGTWQAIAPMPTARGGATAQVLGGLIYVVGGLAEGGGSASTVEIYDPVTGIWSTGAPLATPRDNAGSAILDGKLFVFGGRFRNANGTVVNGTLASTEMFDPAVGGWTARAPMPTGRRTFATVVLNGKALVMGGEATAGGGAFGQNEEYDAAFDTWRTLAPLPTPRHGCAAAVIGGEVFVAGGGLVAGSSFSNILEVFSFSGE